MIKPTTVLLTTLLLAGFATSTSFAGDLDAPQAVAIMGGHASPAVATDSAVQKAIEALIKQQGKQLDLRKKIPAKQDNPIGEINPLRNSGRELILGGAEAMPM